MDCGSMYDTSGEILPAIQSRLSRRILPRLTDNGCVEYGIQIPVNYRDSRFPRHGGSSMSGSKFVPEGTDIDWIMKGSGSISRGSAGSNIIPKVTVNPGSGKSLQATSTLSLRTDEYTNDIQASQDTWNRHSLIPGIG